MHSAVEAAAGRGTGALIVNADDWGQDRATTDRTLECFERRSISSVSAMVFMADSERAADVAKDRQIDAGLHLNLTTPFAGSRQTSRLFEHHGRVCAYLRRRRLAMIAFHPGLVRSFDYAVKAQLDEYERIFGAAPERIDGHHHMHLCANVLMTGALPAGTTVRRNFHFQPGEKHLLNRVFRGMVDRVLARRHRLADFLFNLAPVNRPQRLERIFSLAKKFAVEVETHPVNPDEYRFLMEGEIFRIAGDVPVARRYMVGEAGR